MSYLKSFAFASVIGALLGSIIALFQTRSQTYCYTSIRTFSSTTPTANCFSISKAGTFSKVFALDAVSAKKHKYDGHVLPGLWDGHGHLLQYGEMLQSVNLFGSQSLSEAQDRIVTYAREHPNEGSREEWIRGIGWDQAAFGGEMPTAADLDINDDLKHKYIMLDRVDVHCIWVSKAVLDLLPDNLPDIPGGEIITKPGMGTFCDNAIPLVQQHWPRPGPKKKREFLTAAAKDLNSLGLVGAHDAGMTLENIHLLNDLAKKTDWSLRVYGMFECDVRNTMCPQRAPKIDRKDGYLIVRSVKLFADGALGSWGSAMIEPYNDRPNFRGSLLVNGTVLTALTKEWAQLGYQVNIHAIGDMANRLAIDAITTALSAVCPSQSLYDCQAARRFRIEHAQIMHPDDQARLHKIGIIPSVQPTHATSDMSYAEDRLGKKRTDSEAYRMRSFLDLKPVLGSDFPVEPPNPWQGIYAATTRKSPQTRHGKKGSTTGWHIEESLDLDEALHGFTTGPARGAFLEGRAGVIKEGAYADWIVLDRPVGMMSIEDILDLKVRETWVAGRRVYKRED